MLARQNSARCPDSGALTGERNATPQTPENRAFQAPKVVCERTKPPSRNGEYFISAQSRGRDCLCKITLVEDDAAGGGWLLMMLLLLSLSTEHFRQRDHLNVWRTHTHTNTDTMRPHKNHPVLNTHSSHAHNSACSRRKQIQCRY